MNKDNDDFTFELHSHVNYEVNVNSLPKSRDLRQSCQTKSMTDD